MTVFTLSVFRCQVHSEGSPVQLEQPNAAAELRFRRFSRLVPGPPPAALIEQILEETTFAHDQPNPITSNVVIIPLPLRKFEADPVQFQIDLARLLSSLTICASAGEMIVREITRTMRETAGRLHVVAEVDGVELSWTTTAVEREDHRDDEESEICSICLEELEGGKWEEIEVACGHVFHDFCIYNWLDCNSSCPLCRAPLDLED